MVRLYEDSPKKEEYFIKAIPEECGCGSEEHNHGIDLIIVNERGNIIENGTILSIRKDGLHLYPDINKVAPFQMSDINRILVHLD